MVYDGMEQVDLVPTIGYVLDSFLDYGKSLLNLPHPSQKKLGGSVPDIIQFKAHINVRGH